MIKAGNFKVAIAVGCAIASVGVVTGCQNNENDATMTAAPSVAVDPKFSPPPPPHDKPVPGGMAPGGASSAGAATTTLMPAPQSAPLKK